jgi:glutaredoxin
MAGVTVSVYTRPGCHLCDRALAQLAELRRAGHEFSIREVDIERDEILLRRYLERIPVVELGGEVVSELGLDADELRARLATVRA